MNLPQQFGEFGKGLGAAEAQLAPTGSESLQARIEQRIREKTAQLAELEELKTLLEAHPEIERVMTLLQGLAY